MLPTASQTAELKQDHLSSAYCTPACLSSAQLSSAQRMPDCVKSVKGQTYLVDRILPSTSSSVPAAVGEEGDEEEAEEATGPDEVVVPADMP